MTEKTRRTTKQDIKTLVTMLTMMKISEDDEQDRHIPEFTMKELSIAVDILTKGNRHDTKGIKVENLKRESMVFKFHDQRRLSRGHACNKHSISFRATSVVASRPSRYQLVRVR